MRKNKAGYNEFLQVIGELTLCALAVGSTVGLIFIIVTVLQLRSVVPQWSEETDKAIENLRNRVILEVPTNDQFEKLRTRVEHLEERCK